MTIKEMQDEIIRLKKEKDICILAHAYQGHEILEVADYVGDSFGLSQKAAEASNKNVLMCGVRFMAETVKILAPEKTVYLSHPEADCPMAEQFTAEDVKKLKEQYPGYKVCCYINTTSKMKTECDICVTSSAAKKIIENYDEDNILFIPDKNLGTYIKEQVKDKNIVTFDGCCPIHAAMTKEDVDRAKKLHPEALLLVHPECQKEVWENADYIGSTTGIMDYAKNSDAKEFIIGTENSIVEHLQFDCPDKKFHVLSKHFVCRNMKLTTLGDVYACVKGDGGEEIVLDDYIMKEAKRCIDTMIELGK